MGTLSLPIGIHTYLMTRVLGTLSRAHGGLAAGVYGMVNCGATTSMVIIRRTLSSNFLGMDTMVFWVAVSTLCTNSSLYSIFCPVPLLISLSVRLVIAEVS